MGFRVVAIPLFAAICLASPALTSGEQAKKGRGYSPREGGGSTAAKSGGDTKSGSGATSRSGSGDRTAGSNNRPSERRAESRAESQPEAPRAESRPADRDDDERQRYAVPRSNNAVVNSPRIYSRDHSNDYRGNTYYGRNNWPRIHVTHYPVHYDYWARQYYRWSPIYYAPWSLIYGSIGFPNYGFYGGVGPSPFYFGYNGWGYGAAGPLPYPSPAYGYPHEAGGVRLKMKPRDAQVFVDGHYAGLVDDFDGTFQALRLEAGGHKIEIRMPGFEDLAIDVHVQPGRTVTLREDLRLKP